MKQKIKILLEQFNYTTNEELLTRLENVMDITIPCNHYAIKYYAQIIKDNVKDISLKKGHAIELVSRILFNKEWNFLSKQIPKDFEVELHTRYIRYGTKSIDLVNIDDIHILDKILIITDKKKIEHCVISKQSKDIYSFIRANSFSTERELYEVGEYRGMSESVSINSNTELSNRLWKSGIDINKLTDDSQLYFCIGENNNIFTKEEYKQSHKIKNKEKEIKDFFDLIYKEYKERLKPENKNKKTNNIIINAMDVNFLSLNEWESYFKEKIGELLRYGGISGISIVMATSRATSTDVPQDLKFTQKQIFKITTNEHKSKTKCSFKDHQKLIKLIRDEKREKDGSLIQIIEKYKCPDCGLKMEDKMIQYTCPNCNSSGANSQLMEPLCHKCDYKIHMKPSINGKIIE